MDFRALALKPFLSLPICISLVLSGCSGGVPNPDADNSIDETIEAPQIGAAAAPIEELQAVSEPESVESEAPLTTEPESESEPEPELVEESTKEETVSTSHSPITLPTDFGPFNDYALRAKQTYVGLTEELPLTLSSSSELLTNALFGNAQKTELLNQDTGDDLNWVGMRRESLLRFPLGKIDNEGIDFPRPGEIDCRLVGLNRSDIPGSINLSLEMTKISGEQELWEYEIDYKKCAYRGASYYTGKLLVRFNHNLYTGKRSNIYIAYDDITVEGAKGLYNINGAISWINPETCGWDGQKLFYVNVTNKLDGSSVFYENFSTHSGTDSCAYSWIPTNFYEGKLYNSKYGAITVTTPERLPYDVGLPFRENKPLKGSGSVELNSGNDSLTFSLFRDESDRYVNSPNDYTGKASLSLNFPSSNIDAEFKQLALHIWKGGFSDLNDTDGDGIINGWERAVGLNPNDASDAVSDVDGDSISALMEYTHISDPNESKFIGDALDRKIELSVSEYERGMAVEAVLVAANVNEFLAINDNNYVVNIAADKPGVWSEDTRSRCAVIAIDNSLDCTIFPAVLWPITLTFMPADDGVVTLSASTEVPENDINSSNNVASISLDFKRFDNNYALSAVTELATSPDTETLLFLKVNQLTADTTPILDVSISYPAGITMLSAKAPSSQQGQPLENCAIDSVARTVECRTANYSTRNYIGVFLQLSASEAGDFDIEYSLAQADYEDDISDNEFVTTVKVESVPLLNNYALTAVGEFTVAPDTSTPLALTINQLTADTTPVLDVSISYPSEITMLSAMAPSSQQGQPPESCAIDSDTRTVECRTANYSMLESIDVQLEFSASETGEFDIEYSLAQADHEDDITDNEFVSTVVVERNVQELQVLIDAALPGDTIVFPPGEFVGELTLGRKQLNLVGASGNEPTVLRTGSFYDKGISDMGDNTIISNIHFKVKGWSIVFDAGNNLTIADNTFEPDELDKNSTRTHAFDLFGSDYGSRRDAKVRFVNNTVRNFGSEGKLNCYNFFSVVGWREIYIERNVFSGNNCNSVFSGENVLADYDEHVYVSNNTFVDVPNLFDFRLYESSLVPSPSFTTTFENNILVGVDTIFSSYALDGFVNNPVYFNSSNNLLFQSERDSVPTERMIIDGNATVLSPDIAGDPMFIDSSAGDLKLDSASPAIDAGVNPNIGDMGVVYSGEPVFLDGNLDGVVEPDIGAYEYDPASAQ